VTKRMAHFIHFVQQRLWSQERALLQSLEREGGPIDVRDEKPSVAAIEELESSGRCDKNIQLP